MRERRLRGLLIPLLFTASACGSSKPNPPPVPISAPAPADVTTEATPETEPAGLDYPDAKRQEVYDDYFGVKVQDPYRWLEDVDSKQTHAWVEAEDKLTFGFLKKIPARKPLEKRLTEVWNFERYGTPFKKGGRYFFTKNDGLQAQSVLYWAKSPTAEPKVLLDPNGLSEDGTVALAGYSVSENGKYLAYGLAEAGSDWNVWHVRKIATGKDLPDELKWVKFSGATWRKDSRGFYYGRFPEPKEGAELTTQNFYQKLYYHRVGTPQAKDVLVYERPDHKKWGFGADVTEDGRYLLLYVSRGTGEENLLYYRRLRRGRRPRKRAGAKPQDAFTGLVTDWIGEFSLVGNRGPVFWFYTNYKAPRGRLIAVDVRKPDEKHWKEIIPQTDATLQGVSEVGGRLFANYLEDAKTRIKRFALSGKYLGDVELPAIGSAGGFYGEHKDKETFYRFTSFTYPPTVYRYDIKSGKSTVWHRAKVDFDGSPYQVEQVFYKSKDGTKVPMFLVHRKGIELNGQNPTLLYGYGGFDISIKPYFSITRAVWLEMGGVYAVANIRGGGEYGEKWHQAGTKLHKQNVFDDFIAAAEWLIDSGYTSRDKLAITGRSNGGLLIGAVMTQRPDLFGAALPGVGVMDMLRFHKFTIGWAWVDDYGSSENPEQFKALYAYSPYHNVKDGTEYPPTLITTADHDDRVVPAHSFKFAAALQHAQAGKNPILIRIETRAGHGGGKPTKMRIEEAADELAFLVKTLGMEFTLKP